MMTDKSGKKISAYRAAELLQGAFLQGDFNKGTRFPNVSNILGSDWASGMDFNGNADAYQRAAYKRAAEIYGELPF